MTIGKLIRQGRKKMARDKVHRSYFKADGTQVPGVSSVVKVLNKPALVLWAWGLGIKGIDYRKYVDDKADIGTLGHAMIMAELSHNPLKDEFLKDFTANQIDAAENAALSAFEWLKGHKLEEFVLETPRVSEQFAFGGTPDFYGKVDGAWTVLDFKTGKGLYDDMFSQCAGYAVAILESGFPVEQIMLLNVPRSEDENFTIKAMRDWGDYEEIFLCCLQIYQAQGRIKAADKETAVAIKKSKKEKKNE